ncbi:MAG: hypothetical protein H7X80_09895, partial [bacterium]|nr:hypothetical protein [Candidatus Kapabacteria bacterium]
ASSIAATIPFVSEATGDLHINPVPIYRGESIGQSFTTTSVDLDNQLRSVTAPDVGADEGHFNGGRIALQYPDGGEQLIVAWSLDVRYTVARTVPVFVELSENNGLTWTRYLTVNNPVPGANIATITTPNREMSTARVRVISQLNAFEGDTSNASFSLIRPGFTLHAPNGGERLVPTDTTTVRWTALAVPAGFTVAIEVSTNGGTTWIATQSGIATRNLPDTNRFDWTVPDLPSPTALVRVRIPGSQSFDISNAPLTITLKPEVKLLTTNDGARIFAGEKVKIDWSTINTMMVRLHYSTDNGGTWTPMIGNGVTRLGSSIGTYEWTVPAVNAPQTLVRVMNDERTRFTDVSDIAFDMAIGDLAITSPNGGESFELSEPITVTYRAPHSRTLRLDYSSNGGTSWQNVEPAIDAKLGAHTFTPPGMPTPRARVRVVDEERVALADASDAFFRIMESPSIAVFAPTNAEELMRTTVYPITWQSNRVDRVDIDYSASGGAQGSWIRIASNVSSALGTYNWTVPSQNTAQGKIRISEVGGPVVGESGMFSVVTPVQSVRVIRPNGGETFVTGDPIVVAWASANVPTVTLEYSSDDGVNWVAIPGTFPAMQGTHVWTAPGPSANYRVKAIAGAFSDISDDNFTITRRLAPSITVQYPNGGERFTVDSTVAILWQALDVIGDVTLALSTDNGANWVDIATTDAARETHSWNVPASLSNEALIRVTGDGGVSDVSNSAFAIEAPVVRSLALSTPNVSSIVWKENTDVAITWASQNVGEISVMLSTDNGLTWPVTIDQSMTAAIGATTWRVPHLADAKLTSLRVKVATPDNLYADTSDEAFAYEPQIAGVDDVTTGGGMRIVGVYPNPFGMQAEVRWQQSASSAITMRLYNEVGALVSEHALGRIGAGTHSAMIDAALLPAGVYICELRSQLQSHSHSHSLSQSQSQSQRVRVVIVR